jgi:DNA modification methylase
MSDWLTVHIGDNRVVLDTLPERSVHCVVTSPPYWGLRDYGTATWDGGSEDCDHKESRDFVNPKNTLGPNGHLPATNAANQMHQRRYRDACRRCGARRIDAQLGLEATPEEYVANMVDVFRKVRRVLRDDGTLWLNLGDSYASSPPGNTTVGVSGASTLHGVNGASGRYRETLAAGHQTKRSTVVPGLKPKDLCMVPFRVAAALQEPYYTGRIRQRDDRVWLAAAIDGEGCIFIQRRPAGTVTGRVKADGSRSAYANDQFQPGLRITNTSEAFVRRAEAIAGIGGTRIVEKEGQRRVYEWSCYSEQARALLREVYPHLVAKQHEARLAISAPATGGEAAWLGLKAIHKGSGTSVDCPEPESMYEPGWYLRSDVVWSKPNPMPESVTDRPTKSHEYVFLLAKSPRYYFDQEAVREAHVYAAEVRVATPKNLANGRKPTREYGAAVSPSGRNIRSVWTIPTQPYPGAHFAVFPPALVEPCVKAGTSERGVCPECGASWQRVVSERVDGAFHLSPKDDAGQRARGGASLDSSRLHNQYFDYQRTTTGWRPTCAHEAEPVPATCLDPFAGSGTVGVVANKLSRRAILIDLNPEYLEQIERRNLQAPLGLAG